ncbi:hypothetical protein [Neptunitalea lumnitzerae]|uniref:Uncharacterized protein n=1 Tax=Neptunitalea lumnitzerae TaxID=2965509 RepID=A0ABQ5ML89_9FLAO|nr:hypothetical protein [Neptunitalea sp. Y10]GLB50175.1 hypothetical protein Y10_25430 [Neptunitalea sp. Y10]
MDPIHILYIDRNHDICTTMERVISKQEDWKGTIVQTDNAAKEAFEKQAISIVLLGSGITTENETDLRLFFKSKNANIPIIQHYGGGSGLLKSEIYNALSLINKNTDER